jgi:hypothetical protein
MTKAAITPGTQPQSVKIKTITKDPQPLSTTARGGNKMDNKTRQILIAVKLKPSQRRASGRFPQSQTDAFDVHHA